MSRPKLSFVTPFFRRKQPVNRPIHALLFACALSGSACNGDGDGGDPGSQMPAGPGAKVEPPLQSGCNPLGGSLGEDCFTPFPSSFYLQRDNGGVPRVNIPNGVLPSSLGGVALDPASVNGRDGFSPATPLIAYFSTVQNRIDPTPLPGGATPTASLQPTSPVQLLQYDTGQRVPILAEIDMNAQTGERQALIIYPLLRLQPKTRYVVAIKGLQTLDGKPLPPLSGFASLRDNKLDDGSVRASLKAHYTEIFNLLEQQGVPRTTLQLAWDFTTASDEPIYGRLTKMRDAAFAYKLPSPAPVMVKFDTVNDKPTAPLLRQIIGTFLAPSFLTDDVTGRLKIGADGEPELRGLGQFPLVIHIPECVQKSMTPVPVMIYGHGLFGGALDEMDSSYQREITDRLCVIEIGTDWIGLAEADQQYVINNVLSNFNNLIQLTDRLQQAHINFAYLTRLIASGVLDELSELHISGRTVIDKSRIYYYGISNGGIQGLTQLVINPLLARGALCVPGGFWSRMLWRSHDFSMFSSFLAGAYPDPLDRQILVALSQPLWDYSDPATYAPHVLQNPLLNSGGVKKLLYQEGLGDAQVPNFATRAVVRTMGLSLLNQPVEAVFGVGQVNGAVDSAYVQYDVGEMRPPNINVPPDNDNRVHEAIRRLEAAKQQLQTFLTDGGRVVDTCMDKPCVFPPP